MSEVKKSGEVYEYTSQEIEELIRCKKDFNYFTKYVYVVTEKGEQQLDLRDYQKEMLDIIKNHRFSIIMSSRQSGKCCLGNTLITIYDKKVNKILKITLSEFYNLLIENSLKMKFKKLWKSFLYKLLQKLKIKNLPYIYLSPCNFCNTKISYFSEKVNNFFRKFKNKKFTKTLKSNDYLVLSKDGWKKFKGIGKTIKYDVWNVKCIGEYELNCADTHIVRTKEGFKYVSQLTINDYIETKDGYRKILHINKLDESKHMYDLLNVEDGVYLTNNISSHNTTTIAAYALWYALFNSSKFIGIVSNKFESAKEILARIKNMYECLPDWLKPGVQEYNKHSVTFDNDTRIQIAATSQSSFRGRSINLLVCLTGNNLIEVKNKKTNEILKIKISDFLNILKNK